jgi:hypothetical protein
MLSTAILEAAQASTRSPRSTACRMTSITAVVCLEIKNTQKTENSESQALTHALKHEYAHLAIIMP